MNQGMNRVMTSNSQCSKFHEKLVLSAYGELPDDETHKLALHLKECGECYEEQQQLLALKTLASAQPVMEPDANLLARSRRRLEDSLDTIPPKRWYDRVADWMTRTASGLQSAPVAACLLLVAGAGLGSMGGYWFAERHAVTLASSDGFDKREQTTASAPRMPQNKNGEPIISLSGIPFAAGEIASISDVTRQPNSNQVEVSYSRIEPQRVVGTLADPQVRQLLMLASENGTSAAVRDSSVELLAAECRSHNGCSGDRPASASGFMRGPEIRDALMVALRYDRSAAVRQKALSGLEPYVAEDMRVRNAVLEALMNDSDARIRSAAISILQPVEADTSVRQVLSTVALSDQNSNIRNASRVVLRRVSDIQ